MWKLLRICIIAIIQEWKCTKNKDLLLGYQEHFYMQVYTCTCITGICMQILIIAIVTHL